MPQINRTVYRPPVPSPIPSFITNPEYFMQRMSPAYQGAKAIAPTYGKGMGYAGKAMQSIGKAIAPVSPLGFAAQGYGNLLYGTGRLLQGQGQTAGKAAGKAMQRQQSKVPKGLTKLEPINIPIGKNQGAFGSGKGGLDLTGKKKQQNAYKVPDYWSGSGSTGM